MVAQSNDVLASAQHQYERFVLTRNNEELVFLKIGASVSAQKISDNVYIIRGYPEGSNVPDRHEWVTVFKLDNETSQYEPFAFTATKAEDADKVMRPSQFRAVHKFFRGLGYRNFVYYREKGGLGWVSR